MKISQLNDFRPGTAATIVLGMIASGLVGLQVLSAPPTSEYNITEGAIEVEEVADKNRRDRRAARIVNVYEPIEGSILTNGSVERGIARTRMVIEKPAGISDYTARTSGARVRRVS